MISAATLYRKGWSRAEIKLFQRHRSEHYKHHSVLTHDAQILTLYILLCGLSALIIYFLSGVLFSFLMGWAWPYFVFFLSVVLGFLFWPLYRHFLLPRQHYLYIIGGFTAGWHVLLCITIVPLLTPQAPRPSLLILTGLKEEL